MEFEPWVTLEKYSKVSENISTYQNFFFQDLLVCCVCSELASFLESCLLLFLHSLAVLWYGVCMASYAVSEISAGCGRK